MKKKRAFIVQIFSCLAAVGACSFSYLEKQNELTSLRLYAPKLVREVKTIREHNLRLKYQIQELESPENLMRLAGEERFAGLKHPLGKDVMVIVEGSETASGASQHALASRTP